MERLTDKQMESVIGRMLQIGVLLAAIVVAAGGVLAFVHPAAAPANYRRFVAQPLTVHGLAGVLRQAVHLEPSAVVQLGILLLVLLPVARVIFCVGGFARQRDWTYVAVSASVLAILLYSLVHGGR